MSDLLTLPDLSQDYALKPAQVTKFQQNGHIVLREVAAPAEVAAYRAVISHAADQYNSETRPLNERDTYGRAFLQIMNLWQRDEGVRRFVLAHRFAKIAADLLGVAGVRLYHDQALFKEPHGGPTPWHQDQHYWPLDTDKTVTMWMPLTPVSVEMGPVTFATGSHLAGYIGKMPISDQSQALFDEFVKERDFAITKGGAFAAGDASFHTGWTLHSAPGNSTDQMREVMIVIYFADGTYVGQTDNRNRKADLAQWLPGLKPGDLANSRLNPLLYSR